MPKDAYITARVDGATKTKAEKVLRNIGVSTTDAVNMLLHQIILRRGLPFPVRIPNTQSRRAMAALDSEKGERIDGPTRDAFERITKPRKRT